MVRGLALNGGGGKGAYQIGVWKYLLENGVKLDYISGTSAGGLNVALIAQGDLKRAVNAWTIISPGEVRKIDSAKLAAIIFSVLRAITEAAVLKRHRKNAIPARETVRFFARLLKGQDVLKSFLVNGVFSTEPLRNLIRTNVSLKRFPKTPVSFVTVVRNHPLVIFEDKQYINFTAKHPSVKELLLLATSAIPFLFPNADIGSIKYSDGGIPKVGDNSPVAPLYQKGCDQVIVVHLNPECQPDNRRFVKCNIIDIRPQKSLGRMLNFEGKHSEELIEMGYADSRRILAHKNLN